jgi:hypothetical protein
MATSVDDLLGDSALRRAARLAALREFRPRRIPARLTVVLVMIAAGVLLAHAALGRPHPVLRDALAALRLDDPRVLAAAAGALIAAGLALVLLAAVPGRTRLEPLRGLDPQVVAGVSRRGLGRALAATAARVPASTASRYGCAAGSAAGWWCACRPAAESPETSPSWSGTRWPTGSRRSRRCARTA